MFSLFQALFRWLFQKQSLKFLVVGLDNAGKTTFIESIKLLGSSGLADVNNNPPPTVGLNLVRFEASRVSAIFWDLGGQASLRCLWVKFFAEADGIIFICDICDDQRFEEARQVLDSVVHHAAFQTRQIPTILFFNKMDALPHYHQGQREDVPEGYIQKQPGQLMTDDRGDGGPPYEESPNSCEKGGTEKIEQLTEYFTGDGRIVLDAIIAGSALPSNQAHSPVVSTTVDLLINQANQMKIQRQERFRDDTTVVADKKTSSSKNSPSKVP